jgi:hypothetical protein
MVPNRACNLGLRAFLERDLASEELPKDHSERVNICGFGIFLPSEDLGSHPVRRTDLALVIFDKAVLEPS